MILRTTLDNGVRVVVEEVPGVRSVACGVWVDVGSRDEGEGVYGASHFLEHLLFKGTDRWSALQIAKSLDAVGGEFNAFTSKEYTAYYVRTLDCDIDLGLDILADITQQPALRTEDVDSERNVVIEEILMYEDSPDELVHDLFGETLLADHPLGRPVLGGKDSIAAIGQEQVHDYFCTMYTPDRFVLAVAGNVDAESFVDRLAKRWAHRRGSVAPRSLSEMALPARRRVDRRPTEQAHIVLGVPAFSRGDDRRHALAILAHVFGGGMSSRLFQELREKRGLCYSVYAYRSLFAEIGYLATYTGSATEHARETLDVLRAEWERLAQGISAEELHCAKTHVRGGLALSQEDTGSRMSRIGSAELTLGEVPDIDEVVRRIDAVNLDDVNTVAQALCSQELSMAVIGPVNDEVLERELA